MLSKLQCKLCLKTSALNLSLTCCDLLVCLMYCVVCVTDWWRGSQTAGAEGSVRRRWWKTSICPQNSKGRSKVLLYPNKLMDLLCTQVTVEIKEKKLGTKMWLVLSYNLYIYICIYLIWIRKISGVMQTVRLVVTQLFLVWRDQRG